MKKMTEEDLGFELSLCPEVAREKLVDHIAALEAEAAQARERALLEVYRPLNAAFHGMDIGTHGWGVVRDTLHLIRRAMKSTPAQTSIAERARGLWCRHCRMTKKDHEDGLVGACAEFLSVEMATEENGLLPRRRCTNRFCVSLNGRTIHALGCKLAESFESDPDEKVEP